MPAALLFVIFVVLLVIAIPVSITLGIASVLPSVFDPSFTVGAKYLIRAMFGGLDSFPLLAVPMFVLSGIIMAKGGISKKLFDVFAFFLGNFTAGMPCAVIVTCLFYGAISGSAFTGIAALGSIMIPELQKEGYSTGLSLPRSWQSQAVWALSFPRVSRLSCTAWRPVPLSAACS